jgi:CPA2 family monovalent cation:H+ antiporter-2
MAEAVLTDIGVAVGPVIASIHEHRAEVRRAIMERGELEAEPRPRKAVPGSTATASATSGDPPP